MALEFGSRRGTSIDISDEIRTSGLPLSDEEQGHFDRFDLVESWVSAARILSAVLAGLTTIPGLRRLVFSFTKEACINRFRIAMDNLELTGGGHPPLRRV